VGETRISMARPTANRSAKYVQHQIYLTSPNVWI